MRSSYVREISDRDLLDRALEGMVEGLDPYSRYYGGGEVASLERETSGRYQGIGIVLAPPVAEGRVLFALPGSPAERAGLEVGDRIVAVEDRPVAEMEPGELQRTLGGADGEQVRLRVLSRSGEERSVRVPRARLVDPTVRHVHLADPDLGVGYLAITAFSRETPAEFDRAFEELRSRGMRALVVDVRGNLGGVLASAVGVANRFMPGGLVVSREGRGEPVRYEASAGEARFAGTPLVVLVDEDSASASEVFAAALQDHRAAVIVGSPTYGKGMVQQIREFGDLEAVIKLTTSYYYTPSHRNLERTVDHAWSSGILPDLLVELSPEESRRIHAHLAGYSPPEEEMDAVRAWELEEQRSLSLAHPPDAQLDAALSLFRGERPGAHMAGTP